MAALASKQVDMIAEGDISQVDTLKAIPHLDIHESATAGTAIGQIRIDDTMWDVIGPDLKKGEWVEVKGVNGLRLEVEAASKP